MVNFKRYQEVDSIVGEILYEPFISVIFLEKFDDQLAPLSFRNYHSIVERANSRAILVNAVGPRAPQGFAEVSPSILTLIPRQSDSGPLFALS